MENNGADSPVGAAEAPPAVAEEAACGVAVQVASPVATLVPAAPLAPVASSAPFPLQKPVVPGPLLASTAPVPVGMQRSPGDGVLQLPLSAAGPATNPLALRHERLQGTISKFVTSSGWGFVRSHLFEGELGFKTESIMLECQNYTFREGEGVEFDVQSDERGRPHAVALKPIVNRKPNECLGQRHRGYVRRFADRWGFLNAAAFDGDLFVHRDNLLLSPEQLQDGQPPLRQGQAVEFDVALDDRGRTVAKQITTSALLRPTDWVGRRLHGVIRSFQGAWGFVNCDKFAGDLFVHRDALLGQFQGMELLAGTVVEFDVERDHHKKGGKNRLVARQVAVLQQQVGGMPPQPMMQHHMPPMDPMAYAGMPPGGMYGNGLNPQAATFAPQPPMYYQGPPPGPMPDQFGGYGQPPPPYPYDPHYAAAAAAAAAQHHHAMMQQHQQQQPLPPPLPQQPMAPQYGQPPPQLQYGQPPVMTGVPPPLSYGQPGQPFPQPPYGQMSFPGALPPQTGPMPGMPSMAPMPGMSGMAPMQGMAPMPGMPGGPPAPALPQQPGPDAPADGGDAPQVLLHITTHDWEPDQSGQLRIQKGTLVNVSHRAAHGWVYAATVKHGESANEPPSEGWVPQAVAKRVSLCRVAADWPEEGSGTLGLVKGDLIAVSKEAERGWVYGERIGPKRPENPVDGWLPKKVLEYILV
ncbi:unnamed protein product [Polarella glacialis]|uniref:SH3 domain-containing protein n=1 Tax=Polarella glacialis TaxID=89957 RepID=A0A813EYI2_POLGL|nr:unnamed protein product [Polarella glacialis]